MADKVIFNFQSHLSKQNGLYQCASRGTTTPFVSLLEFKEILNREADPSEVEALFLNVIEKLNSGRDQAKWDIHWGFNDELKHKVVGPNAEQLESPMI